MKIFLSWSGDRSKAAALALRSWIPYIIQAVEPWMSEVDIDAGSRWNREMSAQMEEAKFGIICLTKENQPAPWIHFEAGALAKTISDSFVCPYLIDLEPSEIRQGPLIQFQSKRANEKETWELIQAINKALKDDALPEEKLKRIFDRWFPDLKEKLDGLPKEQTGKKQDRPMEEMVEEILGLVRGIARREAKERPNVRPSEILMNLVGENWMNLILDNLTSHSVEQLKPEDQVRLLKYLIFRHDRASAPDLKAGSSVIEFKAPPAEAEKETPEDKAGDSELDQRKGD